MKKKMNTKKGFTLVEIIVVLVIIAIMAAFAIPAYTGYVDKAKQSEILAEGRTVLIAAQTVGQEAYAKGTLTSITETDVKTLAGTSSLIIVALSNKGVVTSLSVTKGEYSAVYNGTAWTTSKTAVVTASTEDLTVAPVAP